MLSFYLTIIESEDEKTLFEKIYCANRLSMYHKAYQILKDTAWAEDVVHDTFVILANNMKKISNRNDLEIRNYLLIITRNRALQVYNRRKREIYSFSEDCIIVDTENTNFDIEDKLYQKHVFDLIKAMDCKYGDVIILKYYYDMSLKEIANNLKVSLDNVKIRLHRGKEVLLAKLIEENKNDRV